MAWGEDGSWRTLDGSDVHYCLEWLDDDLQIQTSGAVYDESEAQLMADKLTRQWGVYVGVRNLEVV